MTVAYSINAGTEVHGVESTWRRIVSRGNVDTTIDFNDWAENVWRVAKMPMSAYLELQTAQGLSLTSLETNDIDANNSAATYTTAILYRLSSGGHVGVNMVQVEVVFRVKTT